MTSRSSSISRKHSGTLYLLSARESIIDSIRVRPSRDYCGCLDDLEFLLRAFLKRCRRSTSACTSLIASKVASFAASSSSVMFALLKSTGVSSYLVLLSCSRSSSPDAAARSWLTVVSSRTRISKCRWLSRVFAVWVGSCAKQGIR